MAKSPYLPVLLLRQARASAPLDYRQASRNASTQQNNATNFAQVSSHARYTPANYPANINKVPTTGERDVNNAHSLQYS
jgi:hypothetical protein